MAWQRVTLSIERTGKGDGIRLMSEARQIFSAAGFPQDAAVFGKFGSKEGGSSHYFNPGASRICAGLLQRWVAVDCEDPGSPVALLLGNQQAYYEQNKEPY